VRSIAIIPARGGSKGVKDKNIRDVGGQPLISYAIQSAKESKKLTHFVVSTDSEAIAKVSESYGAQVLMRPSQLAEDKTPVVPVVNHVLEQLANTGMPSFDIIVLLQPTSPIRTALDIDRCIEMIELDSQVDGVISVVAMDDTHPARMYSLDADANMTPLIADGETRQRQDLEPVYYRNGCIYAVRNAAFQRERSLMVKQKKGYVMPSKWLANIDDERDLIITDVLVRRWKEGTL
jgi:CMP-N,N'-diacetyllegionaminic acid synthase